MTDTELCLTKVDPLFEFTHYPPTILKLTCNQLPPPQMKAEEWRIPSSASREADALHPNPTPSSRATIFKLT